MRVRDLPIVGRVTYLVWRKRRYRCGGCGRTFTESHRELPPRERVTRRFRRRLLERVRGGAAHAEVARGERTTRYRSPAPSERARRTSSPRAARRGRRGGCRSTRPTTAAARSSPRSSPTLDRGRVVEVLDGCSRRRVERYLRSLPAERRWAIEVVSIDPYEAYRQAIHNELPWAWIVVDHFPPRARRQHRARLGPARAPARGQAAQAEGRAPFGQGAS